MKKTLIALCMLFVAFNVQAQEADAAEEQAIAMELAAIDLGMKVDTELFQQMSTNMYVSQSPKAMAMGLIVPETYENAKGKLETNLPPEFKISKKEEITINGVVAMFVEGTIQSPEGVINCVVYCTKRDADTSIMFMGMTEVGIDKKYEAAINDAVNSLIKK